MQKFSYKKSDFTVTPIKNGYILKTTDYPYAQYCYHTFEELVNCLAWELGLLAVGETVKLNSSLGDKTNS